MDILASINPFIRFCDTIPNPCTSLEFVKSYDCRLFYIISGRGTFYIGDNAYSFNNDSLFLFPSGTKYKFQYEQSVGTDFFVINFDYDLSNIHKKEIMSPECFTNFDESRLLCCPDNQLLQKIYFMQYFSDIRSDLMLIREELIKKEPFYIEKSSAILKNVIIEILRYANSDADSKIPELVRNIKEYINLNYSKEFSSERVSHEFGYHPYHINRLFKSYLGTTVYQYLIECRIKEAKKLLSHSEYSIDKIAFLVGIENQSHFTHCFKNLTGVTPSQYRKLHTHKIL